MNVESTEAPIEPTAPLPRRRRWKRGIVWVVAVVALVVLLAPRVIAWTSLRNTLLTAAFRDIKGTVTAESATLGWFSPIAFHGIEIRPLEGEPLLRVASFAGDTPLWKIVFFRDNLGHFRCEQPFARIVVSPGDSNFKAVFANEPEKDQKDEPTDLEGVPRVNVAIEIVDASISLQRVEANPDRPVVDDPTRWTAQGINLSAGIRRSTADPQQAAIYIDKGTLVDHAAINRDVSHAWLKYIAPILAGSTNTEGSFSVTLDNWEIPLDAPEQGNGGGQLIIHALDVTPGAVGRAITEFLRLPTSVVASQQSVVEFRLDKGRVHHKDLKFTLGGLPVNTYGSVGLDQSLDLMAEVTLPHFQNEQAPIRRALSGRVLKIPIHGTLAKPEVDRRALTKSGMDLLNDVLANVGDKRGAQGAIEELPAPEELNAPTPEAGIGPDPAAVDWQQTLEAAIPLVQEAIRNRRERMRERADQQRPADGTAPAAPPPGTMPEQFPERPVRNRLRRLLDALGPPVESAAPAPATPPAPPPPE